MSRMLAGASWAFLAILPLTKRRAQRILVVGAFLGIAYAQALTGGRMGYVTWGVVGLVLCLLRWRKHLLWTPLVPIAVVLAFPGVAERALTGFGAQAISGEAVTDTYEVTAGRMLIWPHVIEKIGESPVVGHGKLAMVRTGLRDELGGLYGQADAFSHPHNAYLQLLLDGGMIGFILVGLFFLVVTYHATRLFLDSTSRLYVAVGGVALAFLLALLVASMGSQTFYPREGDLGVWAALGLMLRVSVTRQRSIAARAVAATSPAAVVLRHPVVSAR